MLSVTTTNLCVCVCGWVGVCIKENMTVAQKLCNDVNVHSLQSL